MADTLKKFGKYFLLDLLAQGGMAEIYRARHATPTGGGRLLAIKRIQSSYSSNPEFINMFRGETKVTSSFTHPNIIQVYDYGEEQGALYIAMEYVDGRNLRQFISRLGEMKSLFPVEVTCFVMEQSCQALQYAHDFKDKFSGKNLNIIHRDISPQNILISYDGAVKVIDFGIAKTETQSESTRAGVIKGKPSYLSPEQISGETLDGRSDVFALGIVFWELLTGRKLFAGDNDLAVIRMIENCQNHVKPPSLFNPKVPKELDAIMFKALEKDRNRRYQSAGEMQRAIHKFLYQFAPEFNPADLAFYARNLFKGEIVEDRKRLLKLNEKAEELIQLGTSAEIQAPSGSAASAPVAEDPTGLSHKLAKTKVQGENILPKIDDELLGEDALPEMDMAQSPPTPPAAADAPPPPPVASKPKPVEKPAVEERKGRGKVIALDKDVEQSATNIKLEKSENTGSYQPGVMKSPTGGPQQLATGTGSVSLQRPRPRQNSGTRSVVNGSPQMAAQASSGGGFSKVALIALLLGGAGYYAHHSGLITINTGRTISSVKQEPKEKPAAPVQHQAQHTQPAEAAQPTGEAFASNSILLLLKVTPAGGSPVFKVNGATVTLTPQGSFPVPLDKPVELTVERNGFETFKKTLVFESSRLAGLRDWPLEVELVPQRYGFLSINTTPSAEAIIEIEGGEERVQTPFSGKRLPVGKYRIRLENKLLQMSKNLPEVAIEENRVKKIEERLSVITDTQ